MKITHKWLNRYVENHFKDSNFEVRNRDMRVGGYAICNKSGSIDFVQCSTAIGCLSALEALQAVKKGEIKL